MMKKYHYLIAWIFCLQIFNSMAQQPLSDSNNVYATGKIVNDKKEGPWIYYKNGIVIRISYYQNNTLNGLTLFFYESGHLNRELIFEKGLLNGNVKFYSQEGELIAIYLYNHDLFSKTIYSKVSSDSPPKGHGYYPLDEVINMKFNDK